MPYNNPRIVDNKQIKSIFTPMSSIQGMNILVTGGASGIGRGMVETFLNMGAKKVFVWDINEHSLNQLKLSLPNFENNLFTYKIDISKLSDIKAAATDIINKHGYIDILINNAGIVVGKLFKDHTHEEIDSTMAINTNALMHTTLEFLPQMIQNCRGHIVNISSAAGYVANPKMSVYCASKWAVIGWSDSLRLELEKKKGLHVTTVTPYYINTGMFTGIKTVIPILESQYVVNKIIRGIQKNKIFIRMPWLIQLTPFLKGILPVRIFDFVADKIFGIYKTMDTFIGRKE